MSTDNYTSQNVNTLLLSLINIFNVRNICMLLFCSYSQVRQSRLKRKPVWKTALPSNDEPLPRLEDRIRRDNHVKLLAPVCGRKKNRWLRTLGVSLGRRTHPETRPTNLTTNCDWDILRVRVHLYCGRVQYFIIQVAAINFLKLLLWYLIKVIKKWISVAFWGIL